MNIIQGMTATANGATLKKKVLELWLVALLWEDRLVSIRWEDDPLWSVLESLQVLQEADSDGGLGRASGASGGAVLVSSQVSNRTSVDVSSQGDWLVVDHLVASVGASSSTSGSDSDGHFQIVQSI